jgi:5-methyltetrahydrofolate--homocysteine methyltransferase
VSFGLPQRENLSSAFLTWLCQKVLRQRLLTLLARDAFGLSLLLRLKRGRYGLCGVHFCVRRQAPERIIQDKEEAPLETLIQRGFADAAYASAKKLLESASPVDIIEGTLVPALDKVGRDFEAGRVFLPQLLRAAEASQRAF